MAIRQDGQISVPDRSTDYGPVANLGPAMQACTDRERRFVIAMITGGGRWSQRHCALMAGYSDASTASLDAAGSRLANSAKIQRAIQEVAKSELGIRQIAAVRALSEIAEDVTHRDRLKAAVAILDRTGMPATKVVEVHQEESRLDKLKKIVSLAKTLGKDPREMLGMAGDVTPAEMIELTATEVFNPTDGLEDVL